MATPAAVRSSPSPMSRRTTSMSSGTAASIARGATARAAVSPRVSSPLNASHARRLSLKGPLPSSIANGDTPESLAESLRQETERKEQLLVQIQDKDQTISTLTAENSSLASSLTAAETRVNELYEEQSRTEGEIANRIDISEKLRTQLREMEKEKRDLQRRYNEQTATFDAERQALYDNEQHLKSRIQSLMQAKRQVQREPSIAPDPESEVEPDDDEQTDLAPQRPSAQNLDDPESEPAEMTALKLELSTLMTSYTSLQSTVGLVQTQLMDLKRVNQELQEENESYMILLRERTLNGQFDVLRHVGGNSDDDEDADADAGSLVSAGTGHRSVLNPVEEEVPGSLEDELRGSFNPPEIEIEIPSRNPSRSGRKRGPLTSHSPTSATRGESLADLPITGPGLDLAAELGRAENKDIADGKTIEDRDHSVANKRSKKGSDLRTAGWTDSDIELLKSEVKSLKDANKALSLYASKIIDRIIAEEGFEHVLAVDYDQPSTPATPGLPKSNKARERPQSVFVGRSTSSQPSSTFPSPPTLSPPISSSSPPTGPTRKAQRRSLSFDWKTFSIFNSEKKTENTNLRPLTLKPGASPVVGARKLEKQHHEDEEDRKERERLNATMKLMGIEPAPTPSPIISSPPMMQRSNSSASSVGSPPTATVNRRFSLFGARTPPVQPQEPGAGAGLTHDALVQAEAENTIAALDAHERSLSAEIAKGSSGGIFTEVSRRSISGRRSRRSGESGSGRSGSTVFSAGIEEE